MASWLSQVATDDVGVVSATVGSSRALIEGGTECGSYDRRQFGKQDAWSADRRAPRDRPVLLTAFAAWLVCRAPEGTMPLP